MQATIQKCKQLASQSGFNNDQSQECANLICTHPGENATCTQEGVRSAAAAAIPTPIKLTCEQCFTKFLSADQLRLFTESQRSTLELICAEHVTTPLQDFEDLLTNIEQATGQSIDQVGLIQCLQNAGIVFSTGPG